MYMEKKWYPAGLAGVVPAGRPITDRSTSSAATTVGFWTPPKWWRCGGSHKDLVGHDCFLCGKSMNILEICFQWKMWNIIPTWSNRYQNHGLKKLRWGIDGNHVEIAVHACDLGVSMIADWAWWDEHVRSLTKQTVAVLNAKPPSFNQWIYGIDIGNLFQ